jgi:hypothetical protein
MGPAPAPSQEDARLRKNGGIANHFCRDQRQIPETSLNGWAGGPPFAFKVQVPVCHVA